MADHADRARDSNRPPASAGDRAAAPLPEALRTLLAGMTGGPCLMTAAFEDDRAGVRLISVMSIPSDPMMICIAVRRGHSIEPLIRDSHGFAVCGVDPADRLVLRKFPESESGDDSDPFASLPIITRSTGSPIPKRCLWAVDCEVVRHFDLDADCEIYVGGILDGVMLSPPSV